MWNFRFFRDFLWIAHKFEIDILKISHSPDKLSHDSTDEVLFGDVSSELYSTLSCSRLSSNLAIWLLKSECSMITITVTIWSIWDNFKVVKPSGLIHKCSEVFSKKVFKCVDKYLSSNPNQETSNNEDKWGLSKCSRIFHEGRQRVQHASGNGGGEKRHRQHRLIAPGNYHHGIKYSISNHSHSQIWAFNPLDFHDIIYTVW